MRAQEIIELYEQYQIPRDFETRYIITSSIGSYLTNASDLWTRVEALSTIPGMASWAIIFNEMTSLKSRLPDIKLSGLEEKRELVNNIAVLRIEVEGIAKNLREKISQQTNESIYVKIPENKTISVVCHHMAKIDKAISLLVCHPKINGQVALRSWESGSLWVELFLATAAAVNVVGATVWAAAVIRKKILEGDLLNEHVKSLSVLRGF